MSKRDQGALLIGKFTDIRIAGTVTLAGNKLTLNATCPGAMMRTFDFEADGTSYKNLGRQRRQGPRLNQQ